MHGTTTDPLTYPHPVTPKPGELTEVASRHPVAAAGAAVPAQPREHLPDRAPGGWAVVDTGIGTDQTKATWDAVLSGPLKGAKITQFIVTHSRSRPHRSRRLARGAFQVSAGDDADRILPRPVPSDSPHRGSRCRIRPSSIVFTASARKASTPCSAAARTT